MDDQALVDGINRLIGDLNLLLTRTAKKNIDVHIQVCDFMDTTTIPIVKVYYLTAKYKKELTPS